RGDIEDNSTINFDAAMDVSGVERIAPLFFFDSKTTKGELELNVVVRSLKFPVKKLPYINGYAKIRNGILKLPQMHKPFEDINLTSTFQGDNFNIDVNNLKFDKNILNTGTLHVEGFEFPRFSLFINMDNFEYDDLQPAGDFEIPVVYKNSIMSNASGDIFLRTKKIKIGIVTGENLNIKGAFNNRILNVSELKMDSLEGNVDSHGSIDFSAPLPHMYANGKLNNIASGVFLESFGGKSQVIEGKTTIYGHIDSSGKTMKELSGNISGDLAIYSQNGLIKRWNLLSKIFGLLNVYDVFRGKSDLAKEGLPYTRMGATFSIKNGIFSTKNFLIDSPSMLINGDGKLNMKKNEIDGTITVSPLVTVDRTIDRIPILRNILKEKEKGFLYVVYNVKGQLDNPDINVSFTNSVGHKTIEILKNILVLPKGMFE
ncbi:MAG: AsmA-like C-terminal region-containing protein, partial [Proteobacteria bacterium]|nr:AsmA-like C-terminal region-containing protein [Pseudomonadota bacterium]